jgi:hypothetical protein
MAIMGYTIIEKQKSLKKGGERKMKKRLILLCLLAGICLLVADVYASDYYTTTTTHISNIFDELGALLDSTGVRIGERVTVEDGSQVYTYEVSGLRYHVENGKSYGIEYMEEHLTITDNATGEVTKFTRVTQNEYTEGRLTGGSVTIDSEYYDAEGNLVQTSQSTETYTQIELIAGQDLVTESATTSEVRDANGNISQETTSITRKTYETHPSGVVKLVRVETEGGTNYYGETDDNGNTAYKNFHTIIVSAFDESGNLIESGVEQREAGTDPDTGETIYEYYDANGNQITDQNGNGSIADELLAALEGTSYTTTSTDGYANLTGQGWTSYTQIDISSQKQINGITRSEWTFTEMTTTDAGANNTQDNTGDDTQDNTGDQPPRGQSPEYYKSQEFRDAFNAYAEKHGIKAAVEYYIYAGMLGREANAKGRYAEQWEIDFWAGWIENRGLEFVVKAVLASKEYATFGGNSGDKWTGYN